LVVDVVNVFSKKGKSYTKTAENFAQKALLKEKLELEKSMTSDGKRKYTIKPFEEALPFDKVPSDRIPLCFIHTRASTFSSEPSSY